MESVAELIRRHLNDDVYALATKSHWFEPYDKQFLLRQIQSRQKAKSKLPSWYGNFDLLFPPPLSVEQCSSESAALYKASLVQGDSLVDMTGGMGVDASAMAPRFQKVLFFERQPDVAEAAKHNFNVLGLSHVEVRCEDSVSQLSSLPPATCYYLDPARRKQGQKVFLLEDCEPNVLEVVPAILQKDAKITSAARVLLKLSPMFDISKVIDALPQVRAVHIVAVHNEVKELLVELGGEVCADLRIVCVDLGEERRHYEASWGEVLHRADLAGAVAEYLYEPHPSIMKAGLMDTLAHQYGLSKLHPNSHLYTSSVYCESFFGRRFRVEEVLGFSKAELKKGLAEIDKANITIRNFPLREAELRKRLKLADGGDITLIATTLCGEKHVLLKCRRC